MQVGLRLAAGGEPLYRAEWVATARTTGSLAASNRTRWSNGEGLSPDKTRSELADQWPIIDRGHVYRYSKLMSSSERVMRRKEATRQRIVETALELFLAQGFEQTSVAQITEAADIGKGTFFTYFATKQDVLSFLGEQILATMAAADLPGAGAEVRLRRVFSAAGDWFVEHEALARLMCIARMSSLAQQAVTSSRGQLISLLGSVVDEGLTSGEFREVNHDAAVTLVASAYFAPVAQWTWDPDGPTVPQRLAAQLDLALAALAA
ncbi:TetR/AcrR family transcriptional regulator [Corynebacterium amycolatum]|nr:TetR/AcrR family transcriptional regulator [Corynebacterium amycolatum]